MLNKYLLTGKITGMFIGLGCVLLFEGTFKQAVGGIMVGGATGVGISALYGTLEEK